MVMPDFARLVAVHGYWLIGAVVGLESMGLPLPGETTLIAAAIFAGTTHGLDIALVIATAAAAAIAGDSAGFWIGRWCGPALIARYGTRLRITPERVAAGQHLFARHGGKVVFFGRFVALLRTLAALLAGMTDMAWPRFLMFNASGALVWAVAFGTGAYLLGERMERVHGIIATVGLVGAVLAAAAGMMIARRHEARLVASATAATAHPPRQDPSI